MSVSPLPWRADRRETYWIKLLAEALELAPYGKFLYSSDAFGLPELYYLSAALSRRAYQLASQT